MPTGRNFLLRACRACGTWHLALLLTALLASGPAFSDDYAPVQRMLRAGQPAQALAAADKYLAGTPRDPQMQFLRALALADSGRDGDAIDAYTRLTQDYPELPEPYNNLAVLLASQNELDKARALLEMAIRNHPGYATAHENLGDIHVRLAVQAWARARQLDPGRTTVTPKLAAVRSIAGDGLRAPPKSAAPRPAASATPLPIAR